MNVNKKIISTSKGLNIFLKFIGIFILLIVFSIIIGVVFNLKFVNTTNFESSQSSFLYFNVTYWERAETALVQMREGYTILITDLLISVVYAVLFFLASFIFKDISKGASPFTELQIKRLKTISWLLIGTLFIPIILPNILHWIMVPGKYFSISLDGMSLIVPILFYALVEVFAYGALLQREVDETL